MKWVVSWNRLSGMTCHGFLIDHFVISAGYAIHISWSTAVCLCVWTLTRVAHNAKGCTQRLVILQAQTYFYVTVYWFTYLSRRCSAITWTRPSRIESWASWCWGDVWPNQRWRSVVERSRCYTDSELTPRKRNWLPRAPSVGCSVQHHKKILCRLTSALSRYSICRNSLCTTFHCAVH